MTLVEAMSWMARLGAVATAVAALELLWVHKALARDGVFAWPVLRRELTGAPWPVRALADLAFSHPGTLVILGLQLGSALALPWIDHPAIAWIAFGTTLAISVRFRGSYNGGSDSMMLVVLLSLAVARSASEPQLAQIAVGYAGLQLVLSYFIAGVAKLAEPAWRSGTALPQLLRLPQYRAPAFALAVASRAHVARLGTWSMLGFELGFPVAVLHPDVAIVALCIGAAFHLMNAVVLGLNRFLWAWLAAYPALLYCATELR